MNPPAQTTPATPATRHVPCPTCKGPALFHASNRWRPFCSERCRQVDLGAWASEQFRVAGAAPTEEDLNQAAPPRAP
jgi:endogenous inhibitor of DNA gyrase (YacG/DUF329 family)